MRPPLSERLRPATLEEFFGHPSLREKSSLFSSLLAADHPLSILLWGPPGCGKTTLSGIYIRSFGGQTFAFHPASHGLADLKKWITDIKEHPLFYSRNILFIDEIHRLNKGQQDALLPFLEDGTFTLVGATTENPSFSLTSALLSRIRVIPLQSLDDEALGKILDRALAKTGAPPLSEENRLLLLQEAKGDARHLLNCLENWLSSKEKRENGADVFPIPAKKPAVYDRSGDGHYGYISALHKAVRGSDPDAALYWLARMLEGGEDRNYLARRILRMAVEDIGLADPQAQSVALTAWQTYERLGSPEGDLALAEAVLFLALSPKSVKAYKAFTAAKELAERTSSLSPPPFLINAPNAFMKSAGFGKGYVYDPDTKEGFSGQNYFPEGMSRPSLYEPDPIGFERELCKRKDFFTKKRQSRSEE